MKNKRFLKITLIAAVVALLCAALCGCSLIQGILHPEGKFALSESEITLKIGETYDVTLSNGRTTSSLCPRRTKQRSKYTGGQA